MGKLVLGIGINDRSIPSTINGKSRKEYQIWHNMLRRVASKEYQDKNPTYKDCTISESFKYFHLFFAWYTNQIGANLEGYCLDKDLLIKDNKLYSENTCVLLPIAINQLLVKSNSIRGELPIGVSKDRNVYRASCSINGKYVHVGSYNNPDEAFEGYKSYKEDYIKKMAEEYKSRIEQRAYQALLNYKVEKGD